MMQQYLLNAKAANPVLLVNHALKINTNCNVLYELKNVLYFCLDGRTSEEPRWFLENILEIPEKE